MNVSRVGGMVNVDVGRQVRSQESGVGRHQRSTVVVVLPSTAACSANDLLTNVN